MPTLANLADQSDATAFGYGTITAGLFARASARVRAYVGMEISAGTATVTVRGPSVLLPQRPVTSVTSVKDASDPDNLVTLTTDEWVLRAGGVLEVPAYGGNLEVAYSYGWSTVPDAVVEVVCAVASRMANSSAAAASGVQQETGGSESVTFGFDSYNAISELSTGEKRALDRLFPKRPGLVVMRAGSVSLPPSSTRF